MTLKELKLTFVYPDFENLGIEYLMALCRAKGSQVELVSYRAENSYLGRQKEKVNFGKIAIKIADTSPDLVCFSCVTDNYRYQLQVARAFKKIKPRVPTIFGGIHPTAVPEVVLRERAVDAVAVGEAEISFMKFLQACQKKEGRLTLPKEPVKGIVFKSGGKQVGEFVEGELVELDQLPLPDKAPFVQTFKELKHRYTLMTSRGCPYRCTYCFHTTMAKLRGKEGVRQRSEKKVIEELIWAKKKYQFKVFYFVDDNFTTNRRWLLNFLKLYQKKVKLPFGCASHPECMDEELAVELAKAGCIFITIGVQTLSPELSREVIKRPVNKEKIIQAISSLKKAGVMVQVDHLFGIPGDTLANQEEAILFYNQHRPDLVSVFWLTYYPQTPIVETAKELRILSEKEVKKIAQGWKLTPGTLHSGGSMKSPQPFYGAQLVINYLPFLPKPLVKLLVRTHLYRYLGVKNYYLSTVLPRVVQSLFDKRYFWGRNLLVSFFDFKN